jgi:hypothetical protein
MTASALRALADRVEGTEPSLVFWHEVEEAVRDAIGWYASGSRFTDSVDAAMKLLPRGTWAEGTLSSPSTIEVHSRTALEPLGKSTAPTPARAIVAAALRARAAMEDAPDWGDIRGSAPGATNGLSSEAFVRELRENWHDDD